MLDIREEIKLLVEIKDIRDEINIILSVLHIQKTLTRQIRQEDQSDYGKVQEPVVDGIVRDDIADFTKMNDQARTIQDKVRLDC